MDTKKIDQIIHNKIETLVNEIIDDLSGRDYYDDFLDELKREGIELNDTWGEPSDLIIHTEDVESIIEMLESSFSQRFYFSKEDCGQV